MCGLKCIIICISSLFSLSPTELTPVTITFPGDHNTFTECGVVAIETDVEKGTVEKYTISLRRHAGLDRRIMLDEEGAEVIVTDEDGKIMALNICLLYNIYLSAVY